MSIIEKEIDGNAFDEFRKSWEEMYKYHVEHSIYDNPKIRVAIDIHESLRHGKITRDQAIERINKELLGDYKKLIELKENKS